MNTDHDLSALAELCGILPRYHDLHGGERVTNSDTQKALLTANGINVSSDHAIHESLVHLRHQIDDRWFPDEIILESGVEAHLNFGLGAEWSLCLDVQDEIVAEGSPRDHITLPPLPSGIYVLTATASGRTEVVSVLVAPKRLPDIHGLTGQDRLWGMNLALYGLQSERNTGLGDFNDLGQMATIAGTNGASFLGINPVHNMGFHDLAAISPYSPSHRGFLNTSYIALDDIPGTSGIDTEGAFDALRDANSIQYQRHKPAHNAQLRSAYEAFQSGADASTRAGFADFMAQGGEELQAFVRYEALSEIHGADWQSWPDQLGNVDASLQDFHAWLQWVADTQMAAAGARAASSGMSLGLYLDLAVGPRRDGAESWCTQSSIATGVSIGAPPDHLSPEGQNWDLAAFSPRKLRAERYAPLRRIIAQTMKHAGIIRIDHVLGLNRSFWIPDDGSAGAYIRQPFDALLAVIKIEAERHSCAVIGEDLGLVPDGFRETMRDHGFYGYSVLQYEKDEQGYFHDPSHGSPQVLSCFSTHDTPTVLGYETGRDIDWWQQLDWVDAETAQSMRDQRAAEVSQFTQDAAFGDQINVMLAQSAAGLVAVQLDDVLQAVDAQNLPGTIDEHPNWRRKYGVALEDLSTDHRLAAVSAIMRDSGRSLKSENS